MPVTLSGVDYHFSRMGGYQDEADYCSINEFLAIYLRGYRLLSYDKALSIALSNSHGKNFLSVGSGRATNEIALMAKFGVKILCSDLRTPKCIDKTMHIINIDYKEIDVLNDEPPGLFDGLISLSLIYNFNDEQLNKFFDFAKRAILPGGMLYLDACTSPDNLLQRIFSDYYLKFEASIVAGYLSVVKGQRYAVNARHNGFYRNDADIMKIATAHGFKYIDLHNDFFDHDLKRSLVIQKLMQIIDLGPALRLLGRNLPWVRIFSLQRQ